MTFLSGKARRHARYSAREIRVTMFVGLLVGLLYHQVDSGWSVPRAEPDLASLPVPDPYARSRESMEILRRQEGAPPSALPTERTGAPAVPVDASFQVIDGDTFRHGGETIRIADIDTPETHPSRCAREAELGARATARLEALLGGGGFELRPIGRDEDRYGRKLRIVERDGRSLGEILVAEGLARPWEGRRRSWCG